jgi:hypothetical protein
MAYFEFNGNAPQTAQIRQLKQSLLTAKELAERVQAQTAQMTLAQAQAQWGVPTSGLTLAQFQGVIDGIVTALAAAEITNLTNQVGFTT